ncbi:hypothetical protein DACRYDRAFT_113668 [Dacryopinax primogenitus]|uniref:Mediator of RNA polymerase II transcription subunit 12 n=1 Tax=Dacryopinax primogenitus (strain DJM 731) TaxID=1858805 RepID=M5GGJ4_DACPD|nr:uncharacterized protein DACRYDRAFT_113668 [Dacryopinax primogenitus]EJU05593.1 hypothetical protein DACRYDRAFT_113668 [Dacryopinax primogenitus]
MPVRAGPQSRDMAGDKKNKTASAEPYEPRPPTWRPPIHETASLGWADYIPDHPERMENVMSQKTVKEGLSIPSYASQEAVTSHGDNLEKVESDETLERLGLLMAQVLEKREAGMGIPTQTSYKMPPRVTVPDMRRTKWLDALADPSIPLKDIAGKASQTGAATPDFYIPHGPKGSELFELLYNKNVPIDRAVWFVRIVGYNDMAPLRKQPGYNPMSYSFDTAKEIIMWYKKQLGEINLPTARLQSTALKQVFKGVMLDADSRMAWCSKFVYTNQLAREFYKESMIDHGTFLLWAAQHIGHCNLAQLAIFARLVDEYAAEMCAHRAFAKALVDNSLVKLKEIETSSGAEHLSGLQKLLRKFIQLAMMDVPEAFVAPRKWPFMVEAVFDVIDAYVPLNPETKDEVRQQTHIQLRRTAQEMNRRNCALLFHQERTDPKGRLGQCIIAIRSLNSLGPNSDLGSFKFFEADENAFESSLSLLLTWAVSHFQYGDHRPYAVSSILRKWLDDAKLNAERQKVKVKPADMLQDRLFLWLHSYPSTSLHSDLLAIAILIGELIRRGVFSYARYVQELVARGELENSSEETSRHVEIIRQTPLIKTWEAQELLHRTSLFDRQVQITPEDNTMLSMQREIVACLPEVFVPMNDDAVQVSSEFPITLSGSRYEQARVIHHWLLPKILNKHSTMDNDQPSAFMSLACYAAVVQLLADTRLYVGLLELNLLALSMASSADGDLTEQTELFTAILDTLERYSSIWACMDANATIAQSLFTKIQKLRVQRRRCIPLLRFIRQHRFWRSLSKQEKTIIEVEYGRSIKDLEIVVTKTAPATLTIPELQDVIHSPSPHSPYAVAAAVWGRLNTIEDWPVLVWENIMKGLLEFSLKETTTRDERVACSKQLSLVLHQIDRRLLKGFDHFLRLWCGRTKKFKVLDMNAAQWELLVPLLIKLCVFNAVSCSTILECFVYPVWRQFSALSTSTESQLYRERHVPCLFQTAILVLCLLLQNSATSGDGAGLTPISLPQLQRLQTRRLAMYRGTSFQALLDGVCYLVSLSTNPLLTPEVSTILLRLKMSLLDDPLFKQQVSRDPRTVKQALWSSPDVPRTPEMEDRMEETLMHLMRADDLDAATPASDTTEANFWKRSVAELDPWSCHRAAVKLQLNFRRLCRIARSNSPEASTYAAQLDGATTALFAQTWSSEELVYIAELLAGIDSSAISELLNKAYDKITEALRNALSNLTAQSANVFNGIATDTINLMLKITSPVAVMESAYPEIPALIMDNFLQTVSSTWRAVFARISPYTTLQAMDSKPIDGGVYRDLMMLTTRLLHFALGVMDNPTSEWKRISETVISFVLQFANFYGTDGPLRDSILFSMLLDTACYLIDDIPHDVKNPNADIIRTIPGLYPTNLSPHMSLWHKERLRKILQYVPRDYYTEGLQHAATSKHPASRVQNRPWEWGESFYKPREMGKQTVDDYTAFPSPETGPSNSRSISLDLFQVKVTRDRVAESTLFDDATDSDDTRRAAEERSTGDGLGGETTFARDWRDAKVPLRGARLPEQVIDDDTDDEEWPHIEALAIQDASGVPGKTAVARQPAIQAAKASRKRPASNTPIDIPDDDDDLEIVEVLKPVTGKGTGKGKAGKAPASSSRGRGRRASSTSRGRK